MRRTVQSKAADPSLVGLDPEQELFDATPEAEHEANLTAMLSAFQARSASPAAPESARKSESPERSETGVVERVMKAHGLTRSEAEEQIHLFGG